MFFAHKSAPMPFKHWLVLAYAHSISRSLLTKQLPRLTYIEVKSHSELQGSRATTSPKTQDKRMQKLFVIVHKYFLSLFQ